MSEQNKKEVDMLLTSLGELAPLLGPVMKELDFVIEIDVDGEAKKEGFEPKVKLKIKIGRSMDTLLKQQQLEMDKQMKMIEYQQTRQSVKDYTEAIQRVISEQLTARVTTSNNDAGWVDNAGTTVKVDGDGVTGVTCGDVAMTKSGEKGGLGDGSVTATG